MCGGTFDNEFIANFANKFRSERNLKISEHLAKVQANV